MNRDDFHHTIENSVEIYHQVIREKELLARQLY